MRILIVGGGGREHALAWKLSQEAEVICAPGNPGIAADAEVVPIATTDFDGLSALARDRKVDLVVVGPEDPLVLGLADRFRADGIPVYGPGADGAALEASKAFSKAVMAEAGVRTAEFMSFTDPAAAADYARSFYESGRQVAVKASGNAVGKGVIVASTLAEAQDAIREMMVDRKFGDAGATVVIEERLFGREFSLLTLVGDHNVVSLPIAQDHKRIGEGETGPNTGGMGTFSPCEWVSSSMVEEVEAQFVRPVIAKLREKGIGYRGTLFTGVMVANGQPYCLEYNVRFGDPETQSVMLRLGSGLAAALFQAATGAVIEPPEVLKNHAVTVVVSSPGYPGSYPTGLPIAIEPLPFGTRIFHAGTRHVSEGLVTGGGRVFGVSGVGDSLRQARDRAYAAVAAVRFEGAYHRRDIGA